MVCPCMEIFSEKNSKEGNVIPLNEIPKKCSKKIENITVEHSVI
jgi:hypothetical protein